MSGLSLFRVNRFDQAPELLTQLTGLLLAVSDEGFRHRPATLRPTKAFVNHPFCGGVAPTVDRVARMVNADDLVGAAEIAERLGLARSVSVHQLRRRHADFPAPVVTLKQAMVWEWAAVEQWAKATGRL